MSKDWDKLSGWDEKYSKVFQLVVDQSSLPFERKGHLFCIKNGSSNTGILNKKLELAGKSESVTQDWNFQLTYSDFQEMELTLNIRKSQTKPQALIFPINFLPENEASLNVASIVVANFMLEGW